MSLLEQSIIDVDNEALKDNVSLPVSMANFFQGALLEQNAEKDITSRVNGLKELLVIMKEAELCQIASTEPFDK